MLQLKYKWGSAEVHLPLPPPLPPPLYLLGGKGHDKKGCKPSKGLDNGKKGGKPDTGKGQPGKGKGQPGKGNCEDKGGIGTDGMPSGRHPTNAEYEEFMAYEEEKHMPKRLKTLTRAFRHQEGKRMFREDHMSEMRGLMAKEKVEEKIVEKVVYIEKSPSRPKPKFAAGQSVHLWWAGWMAGAAQRPPGVKGKSRPVWFSSSVFVMEQICPQACRNAGVPGTSPGTNLRRAAPSIPAYRPACRQKCSKVLNNPTWGAVVYGGTTVKTWAYTVY
jgi:hypothetical protein